MSLKKYKAGNRERLEWDGRVIEASEINIGEGTTFGTNVDINVRGKFSIGNYGRIGDNFHAKGESINIGDYFYHSDTKGAGMWIGGGGSDLPDAHLKIGDRCVMHSGSINLARPVTIGNDVGLSPGVDIITHGFWGSVLEGFPAKFREVKIEDNVIIGWGSTILPGVRIYNNTVVGANSNVTHDLNTIRSIYAGNPAKWIRLIESPQEFQKKSRVLLIVEAFKTMLDKYYIIEKPEWILSAFPLIQINDLVIDTERKTCTGTHSPVTDFFRDFLRRRGIRIYHPRGFGSNLKRK